MIAFCLDFLLVSILAGLLATMASILTVGLALFILPSFWPFVAFFYNGLTVSGHGLATPGMRALNLEMRTVDGLRVSFITAGVHAALLYFSWMFLPIFLVSLFTPDKRCLHDIVAGVIVVRRPF